MDSATSQAEAAMEAQGCPSPALSAALEVTEAAPLETLEPECGQVEKNQRARSLVLLHLYERESKSKAVKASALDDLPQVVRSSNPYHAEKLSPDAIFWLGMGLN
mmetsp:Transcript_8844/g.16156  ORF Transcript_8844/g.16156 Transcript_8844/m.16156 type:complete len:105 (-) Transcript_8844:75-389(-)